MRYFRLAYPLFISIAISFVFFYKTILFGLLPFPGDLLVAEYKPWRTYSLLGYVPGSVPNKAQYPDVIRQLYPWKTLAVESMKNKHLPLWNPYNFSGTPLLANFQSAVFYPLSIIYFLLDQPTAWSTLIILQPILALLFMFLYCRLFKLSNLSSWFGALAYGFSSYMSVWLEYNTIGHVILWLPLIFLSIEKLLEKQTATWMTILTAALVSSLLAGHPQIFSYLLVFSIIYTIVRKRRWHQTVPIFSLFGLSLIICSVQLIPGIELILASARTSHTYQFLMQKILIQPWQLAMAVVPDFFGNPANRNYWPEDTYIGKVTSIGFIPLFFIVSMFWQKKDTVVKFFLLSTATVLLLTTNNPITALLYKVNIPFLSTSSPTLMTFIIHFSLCVVAAFSINAWQTNKTPTRHSVPGIVLLGMLLVLMWATAIIAQRTNAYRVLALSTVLWAIGGTSILVSSKKMSLKTLAVVVLFGTQLFDLFQGFIKFNPFSPREFIFPDTPVISYLQKNAGINRFWGHGSAVIEPNIATQLSVFMPTGYDPLYPKSYGEFIMASYDGTIQTKLTGTSRSDATIAPSGNDTFSDNPYRQKLLDLLGASLILDRSENAATETSFPGSTYTMVYNEHDWKIFRNNRSVPRINLVSDYLIYKGPDDFSLLFFDKRFNPQTQALLEADLPSPLDSASRGSAKLISYEPNQITVRTETTGNKLLIVSDVYYPGWNAYIDDKKSNIMKANYTFRSVLVPAGEHIVRFIYEPISVRIGFALSLMGTFATTAYIWRTKDS